MKMDGETNTRRQDMNKYAQRAIRDYGDQRCKTTDGYLWQAMLSGDLSRPDKTAPRMAEEAMTLLIASGDTGARVSPRRVMKALYLSCPPPSLFPCPSSRVGRLRICVGCRPWGIPTLCRAPRARMTWETSGKRHRARALPRGPPRSSGEG